MFRATLTALALLMALAGCDRAPETGKTAAAGSADAPVTRPVPTAKKLFNEPMAAHRHELASQALPVWREAGPVPPPLVLFSDHPLLDPLGPEQRNDVADLVRTGDAGAFRRRGSFYRVSPALVPTQALSAAIDNRLVSEVVWVVPTRLEIDDFSLEAFRAQVVDAGFFTEEEAGTLQMDNGVARGTLRGIPFRAVHPDALPDFDQPVLVHFDTGYFKGLFKNEVATALYDILHQTVMRVMQAEWDVYATTLSWSTEEGQFSPDVRFLISALARMIEDPQLFRQMPRAWKLHSDAMFVGNMYMEAKSRDLIEAATVAAPDDPAILFALARVRFGQGRADEGFVLLDKAVQLDPGYAVAYAQLAGRGIEQKQYAKALELQQKAVTAMPENPFLRIDEADLLIRMRRYDEAADIIDPLEALSWSATFHPDIRTQLETMKDFALDPPPRAEASPGQE